MAVEWTELFADFEQNLSEWLNRAVEPASEPTPRPAEPVIPRLFEERLKRLQAYLDKAEQDGEQALDPLTSDIQAIRQWLDEMGTARAKLAERIAFGPPGN